MSRRGRRKSARRVAASTHSSGRDSSQAELAALREALAFHQQGRFREAETSYLRILERHQANQQAVLNLAIVYQQTARHGLALQTLERGVASAPRDPIAHYNLANLLRGLEGRLADAGTAYANALSLHPEFADAHYGLGIVKHELKELAAAENCYRAALRVDTGDARYWNSLGTALLDQGSIDQAVGCFERAIQQQHDYAIAFLNLGSAYKELGRRQDEIEAYLGGLRFRTDIPELHNNLAAAWRESGDFEKAIEASLEAVKLRPGYANAHFNLAHSYLSLDRIDAAERAFKRCLLVAPDHVGAHSGLGSVCMARNEAEESITWQRRAIELDAQAAVSHSNLGMALLRTGEAEAAQASLLEAIRLAPSLPAAWFCLSKSRRFSEADDALVAQAEASLQDSAISELGRMNLHFALGKMHEDRKQFETAFEHYQRANQIKHRSIRFDRDDFATGIQATCDMFTSEYFARSVQFGDPSVLPVFIIGLNRSGTTLVEQIVSSHPEVYGAGELIRIPELVGALPGEIGGGSPFPACMADFDSRHAQRLAADYLNHLRGLSAQSMRITDKLPANFLHLGLIATLFPRAHIIHCRRDPMDVCLSNFTQLYMQGNYFSYDLDELAFYYCGYERLMTHWRSVLSNPFYEIQYEELVAQQEDLSRELVASCGLPWHDDCLSFFANKRVVHTASHWQVRQPMYTSSVARWKRYERQLAPLQAAMARYRARIASGRDLREP